VTPNHVVARVRRRLSDETGVVLIVALAVMIVLGLITAGVLVSAVAGNGSSLKDRRGKQALAASLSGLRTALYRINTNTPADDECPPSSAGAAVTPDADGVCGPYSSTDAGAAQPSPSSRFRYWVTPVLVQAGGTGTAPDRCTGNAVSPAGLPANVIKERCVTAVGEALGPDGSTVTATRRVQARLSATSQLFIVPGIWGTDMVQVGEGQSTANIIGAIGSNGMGVDQTPSTWDIDLNAKNWGDSISPRNFGGKDYFLGGDVYFGRAAGVPPTASLVYTPTSVTNPTTFPPTMVTCGTCPTGTSSNKTTVSAITSLLVPDSTVAHPRDLGRRLPRSPVLPLFKSPPPPVTPSAGSTDAVPIYGGPANPRPSAACLDSPAASLTASPCDTARRNDNAAGISQTGCRTPVYTAGAGGDTRTLALRPASNGGTCTITLQNGVYNFCNIDYSSDSAIVPADTSTTAEIYIFIDSNTRDLLPASGSAQPTKACKNGISGVGNITTPNGAGSVTSFMNTAATSLAGQLYFWGAGDNAASGNGTTTKVSHNLEIPNGWQFKGLVFAPNSNVTLNTNVTLQGGLSARTVFVKNGATYAWDVTVNLVDSTVDRRTFYRALFKHCDPRIPVFAGVQRPMDGC
jgi:Tfp pilus assembly protein PilX